MYPSDGLPKRAERPATTEGTTTPMLRMRRLIEELYPLPRSITGEGLRDTLRRLRRELPALKLHEAASGEAAFDWTIPPEWNVREARLTDPDGRAVVDFERHNLHLLNYSEPIRCSVTFSDLEPHLYSIPQLPHAIPYRTSYYRRDWGFCVPHSMLPELERDGTYDVLIDATLEPGSLTYADLVIPGTSSTEVLFSAHVCHPSLANDNLSGVAVLTELARWLANGSRRLTYRILFAPGTIGTITYLSRTPEVVERVAHGLVLAGLGDGGPLSYKPTLQGSAAIDRAASVVLAGRPEHRRLPFDPSGYDERQYASPGIRLPVGRLGRTPPGTYPEYHTSLDDVAFVRDESLVEALEALQDIVTILEEDDWIFSRAPYCEPQLGKRGLYESSDSPDMKSAVLWLLTLADGNHTLLDVAERSGVAVRTLRAARSRLVAGGLLSRSEEEP